MRPTRAARRPRWRPGRQTTHAPAPEKERHSARRDENSAAWAPAQACCRETPSTPPVSSSSRPGSGWPPACRSRCSLTSRPRAQRSCRWSRCAVQGRPAPDQGCRARWIECLSLSWWSLSWTSEAALHQRPIAVWTAVAEELPGITHLSNHVEVQIGDHNFVFAAAGLGDDLAAWIAEIALAIELTDIPRRLFAHTVDG